MRLLLDSGTELEVLLHFLQGKFRKLLDDFGVRDRSPAEAHGPSWETLPRELLGEVIRRVWETSRRFPDRRDVLACAAVCRRWRDIAKEIIRDWAPLSAGGITFLSCLKRSGPHDFLLHCLIQQNKKASIFYLYLSPNQDSKLTDKGKFLMAARRYWKATHMEYILSCNPLNFSRGSDSYLGKLRSDVLGINFTIYDGKPSCSTAHVSYKVNLREPRGPRRIVCSLKKCHSPSDGGGASPVSGKEGTLCLNPKMKKLQLRRGSSSYGYTVLTNKAPAWNEYMERFTLNFHGRATMSSAKNFQLIAPVRSTGNQQGNEKILLQLGKVREDMFTMDYGEPLSAFQAFAICLTSFGWKFPWQ